MRTFALFPYGPIVVWSSGATNSFIFIPLTGFISSDGIDAVRAALEVVSSTGLSRVIAVYRTTNDGLTFNSPVEIDTNPEGSPVALKVDGNGVERDTDFRDISDDTKACPLVQFGVHVSNVSGSLREMALVSARFNTRKR